jgi:hypothetical protein
MSVFAGALGAAGFDLRPPAMIFASRWWMEGMRRWHGRISRKRVFT